MTRLVLFVWVLLSLSLLDTMLLVWLAGTVLLNAERRTWGVWLVGAAMLLGSGFFVCHSVLLTQSLAAQIPAIGGWWVLGWVPAVVLPFAWYAAMLWHAGYWADSAERRETGDGRPAGAPPLAETRRPGATRKSAVRRRHRAWVWITGALGLLIAVLFVAITPLLLAAPEYRLETRPAPWGLPPIVPAYSLFLVLCIGLSLDVLLHPGPSSRVMGDLARRRARPWLAAIAVALLLVSLMVGATMYWLVLEAHRGPLRQALASLALPLAWGDLIITALITLSILFLGEAVVSYEIFTGKTLPRRGLRRYWRGAVLLGLGYGGVTSLTIALELKPTGGLLLAAVLTALFYTLTAWRSYVERERSMEHLRPFMASAHLYDSLLAGSPGDGSQAAAGAAFRALCEDVLSARTACLQAIGPMAPLVGLALSHPPGRPVPAGIGEIAARAASDGGGCFPVEPAGTEGALWAVPLWSARGPAGVLLLGEKRDGGLYTQEEIEIARAGGERILDTQASASIAVRLMALQRSRVAETRVLDQRTRRALHDEVLPRLHAALLALGGSGAAPADVVGQLTDVHRRISELLRAMPAASLPELARLGLAGALRQAIDEELGGAFDSVAWDVSPEAEQAEDTLPPLAREVLFYAAREAARNAARHGRGANQEHPLHLRVALRQDDGLRLVVDDDGVGLGFGTAPAGSGQGLALHSTMMAVIGGELAVESAPGAGTRVTLSLPCQCLSGGTPDAATV